MASCRRHGASEWLKATPNQIILTVSLLDFTVEMGQVFDKIGAQPDAMDNFAQKKIDGLSLLIDLVRTDLSKAVRSLFEDFLGVFGP